MPGKDKSSVQITVNTFWCTQGAIIFYREGGASVCGGGGDQNFLGWSKGGHQFFFSGKKGGTKIFLRRQRSNFFKHMQRGGPEKIGDRQSQTDSPPLPVKMIAPSCFLLTRANYVNHAKCR